MYFKNQLKIQKNPNSMNLFKLIFYGYKFINKGVENIKWIHAIIFRVVHVI